VASPQLVPDTTGMTGTSAYVQEPSRGFKLKIEIFLLAALMLFVAFPAIAFVAKAAHDNVGCVRGAFQKTVTQTCK